MKNKSYIIIAPIVVIMCILLYLGYKTFGNEDQIDIIVQNPQSENELFTLLEKDKVGDRKSVFWDGKTAFVQKDELDDTTILVPATLIKHYESATLEMSYPEEYELKEEHQDGCSFVSHNGDVINIEVAAYKEEIENHDNNENLRECVDMGIRENQARYFQTYKTYVGTKELDGETKAGYTLILQSDLIDKSYKIDVYGTGNMSRIKQDALNAMNSFHVVWD